MNDMRAEMVTHLAGMGVKVEKHHHEVAPSQNELGVEFGTLLSGGRPAPDSEVRGADDRPQLRQERDLHAEAYRRRQRFGHARAPVDLEGRQAAVRGLGLRRSLGHGALLHRRRDPARAGRSTPSPTRRRTATKRLVPGYEAPVLLAYSARNRSASCRIPYAASPNGKRVEVRFPDPSANPYMAFAAMLMAGIDRHREQDPSGRRDGQEPLRPAAGGAQGRADGVRQPGPGARHRSMPTATS